METSRDYYFCPINGHVIETGKDDDMAVCSCGRPNPSEKVRERVFISGRSPRVEHFVARLKKATLTDFLNQKPKSI